MSVAGGMALACERAREAGANVLQLFTKSERQWKARPLPPEEIAAFKARRAELKIGPAFAHDSYLINLASADTALWARSVEAMVEELRRAEALGLEFVVTHPGSPRDAGQIAGLRNLIRGLDETHRQTPGLRCRILLETTAGQGSTIGYSFDQLARLIQGSAHSDRLGVCVDTCHIFAAGYDIRDARGYEAAFEELDRTVGLEKVEAFHLNDSKGELGCRVDRHEHIGKGRIGKEAFRLLMNDPRFARTPMVLETPKEDDMDVKNLKLLRSLRGKKKSRGR
jgi:deoxyribonuclease-4